MIDQLTSARRSFKVGKTKRRIAGASGASFQNSRTRLEPRNISICKGFLLRSVTFNYSLTYLPIHNCRHGCHDGAQFQFWKQCVQGTSEVWETLNMLMVFKDKEKPMAVRNANIMAARGTTRFLNRKMTLAKLFSRCGRHTNGRLGIGV